MPELNKKTCSRSQLLQKFFYLILVQKIKQNGQLESLNGIICKTFDIKTTSKLPLGKLSLPISKNIQYSIFITITKKNMVFAFLKYRLVAK